MVTIHNQFLKPVGRENQDSFLVQPLSDSRYAIAVADGLGGEPNGVFFSQNLIRMLQYKHREIDKALMRITEIENEATVEQLKVLFNVLIRKLVERMADKFGSRMPGGTTLALAWEVAEGRFVTYSIGDSEIMVSSAQTQSPWIVHDLDLIHPGSNQLTNVVNMRFKSATQEPKIISTKEGDTIALYTDGVGDNLHPALIQHIVRSQSPDVFLDYYLKMLAKGDLPQQLQGLQARSIGRPKPDDVTLVVYKNSQVT